MADMPETTPAGEPPSDAPIEQAPLDLVPSFAVEDEKTEAWSPLTRANSDYERLWSMPNGSTHQNVPVADDAPQPASESAPPEPEALEAEAHMAEPEAQAAEPEAQTAEPEAQTAEPEAQTAEPGAQTDESEPAPRMSAPASSLPTPGFTGTLVTGSEVLNSSIVVGSGGIVLWGGGAEIGSWEHSQARIARLTFSRFAIQAEGETLTFTADDPTGLDNAIAASAAPVPLPESPQPITSDDSPSGNQTEVPPPAPEPVTPEVSVAAAAVRRPRIKNFRPEGSEAPPVPAPVTPPPLEEPMPQMAEEASEEVTIADSVRAHSAGTTVRPRRFRPNDLRGMLIKTAVVLGLVAVLAGAAYAVMLLMGRTGDPGATASTQPEATAPPITIVITTAPPVTVATTAAPELGDTTFFQTDAATLTERWNTLAEVSAPNMVLFSDLTSPFILLLTPNVTLEGVLDPVAGNVTMRATPTGTPEGDGAILNALGILIGTADPSLDGSDRKALLAQLGLDVDRPELGGIDGSLTHNGLAYRMVYQAEQNTLEFAITPEGAVTTTAAG